MKGVSVYISWVIVLVLVIIGIAVVLSSGFPVIETSKSSVALAEAEHFLSQLDSAISEVAQEGIGSSRLLRVPPGDYRLIDSGVEFRTIGSSFEPLSRRLSGSLVAIGGSDATCAGEPYGVTPAYRLENSFIRAYLQQQSASVDTKSNVLAIQSKHNNLTIEPADTSIVIDGQAASSAGSGFSELLREGSGQPYCRVRYFVNGTRSYDVFYTLYAGADFLQVEVRNIK
jgi:hypothetical protein